MYILKVYLIHRLEFTECFALKLACIFNDIS